MVSPTVEHTVRLQLSVHWLGRKSPPLRRKGLEHGVAFHVKVPKAQGSKLELLRNHTGQTGPSCRPCLFFRRVTVSAVADVAPDLLALRMKCRRPTYTIEGLMITLYFPLGNCVTGLTWLELHIQDSYSRGEISEGDSPSENQASLTSLGPGARLGFCWIGIDWSGAPAIEHAQQEARSGKRAHKPKPKASATPQWRIEMETTIRSSSVSAKQTHRFQLREKGNHFVRVVARMVC